MTTHTDIQRDHWTLRLLPAHLRVYGRLMRLDRPIGWWLLLLPCWWSLALAWRSQAPQISVSTIIYFGLLFLIGSVFMRGAGCVINDVWDRDIDAKVERTAGRPLPSGEVSLKKALLFTGLLLLSGLLVLIQFNTPTIYWALASLGLVVVYPLAKRVTYWPQFVLGLAFNWGALVGWTAITGTMAWPPLLMYIAGIFWTLGYDTIYAHQDKEDDLIVGVKSTALRFGDKTKSWLMAFATLQALSLVLSGFMASVSALFYVSVIASFIGFSVMLVRVDINSPAQCIAMFKAQLWIGLIIVFGCLLG
ncbi:MAG: 4-hydroxybenzoate octaprenyltransferase [Alphaproteobacteria bacterium]